MANIQEISQMVLLTPIFELLKFFYGFSGNFGLAIILMTIFIRTILVPFTLPTIRSQKKMRLLKPEIDKLKKLHSKDAQKLQKAQMELFKEHGVNPLAGCLPYIVQLIVIIALYNVLSQFIQKAGAQGLEINANFLGLDLSKPDPFYVIPVLAAVTQFIMSLMLLPGLEKHDLVPDKSKNKKTQEKNEKESQTQEMAEVMQKQMVFMMPLMTGLFAVGFPAALGVYWIVTTVYSIVQQWFVAGPGGLADVPATIRKFAKRSSI